MKTIRVALLTFALLVASVAPAFAAGGEKMVEGSPAQFCREIDNTFGQGEFALEMTHAGCVSTVASGDFPSRAAIAGQCQWIRENDPDTFYSTEGPYPFNGQLGRCVTLLYSYHHMPQPE